MNKLLFILGVFLISILSAEAQHVLQGNIHDESATGVPSATIRILTKDSAFVSGGIRMITELFC